MTEAGGGGLHRGTRLVERRARQQPCDDFEAMGAIVAGRVELQERPELRDLRVSKPGWHHANDGVWYAVQRDRPSDDLCAAAKPVLPEHVAQDDQPRSTWNVLLLAKCAAPCGMDAHDVEEGGRYVRSTVRACPSRPG